MVTFWVSVLALSALLYVLLDGFDLGIGILFGLTRDGEQRQAMVSAVNSTIEMDLTGACNSEHLSGHQFTSTGGQLDFVRGAYASKGGLSFIAFQSSIKGGKISKIVPRLSGPVTTPRTDVHYVVTENGVANLKGLSSTDRARALIGLADAAFQDELTAAAKELHLI
jgi:itaconate CoA-transferase